MCVCVCVCVVCVCVCVCNIAALSMFFCPTLVFILAALQWSGMSFLTTAYGKETIGSSAFIGFTTINK